MTSPAGPATTRWTHLALPVRDLEASLAWYGRWTPLVRLHERRDDHGSTAWLGHPVDPDAPSHPFVLVLIEPAAGVDQIATRLAPLAHLGFEMPTRAEVDELAARAREAGVLQWDATDLGPPVGYICAIADPDGNIVEFSHDQGVYAAARRGGEDPGQASSARV